MRSLIQHANLDNSIDLWFSSQSQKPFQQLLQTCDRTVILPTSIAVEAHATAAKHASGVLRGIYKAMTKGVISTVFALKKTVILILSGKEIHSGVL